MRRAICSGIDRYRIWYKITYQRGRILSTDRETWRRYVEPSPFASPETFFPCDGSTPKVLLDLYGQPHGPLGPQLQLVGSLLDPEQPAPTEPPRLRWPAAAGDCAAATWARLATMPRAGCSARNLRAKESRRI